MIINSLIISHQARMICFLSKLFPTMNGSYRKIRFMNCAIVKISLYYYSNKWNIEGELVYNGEIGEDEKKPGYIYFNNNVTQLTSTPQLYQLYPFIAEYDGENLLDVLKLDPTCINPNNIYNFFIMRHGQAQHNLYSGITKMNSMFNFNTELTDPGKSQAKNASSKLVELNTSRSLHIPITSGRLIFDFAFVSDLFRTHQTLHEMLEKVTIVDKISGISRAPIMLPCNHEIDGTDPNCDGRPTPTVPGENQTSNKSFLGVPLKVNVTYYENFYRTRRQNITINSRESCSKNTFIGIAMQIIFGCRKIERIAGKTRRKRKRNGSKKN